MKIKHPIRCPNCKTIFYGKHTKYTHETRCPKCSDTFVVGLKHIEFQSEGEKNTFLKTFDDEIRGIANSIFDRFKKGENDRIAQKRYQLRCAADKVFAESYAEEITKLIDIVPIFCMNQWSSDSNINHKEIKIPRIKRILFKLWGTPIPWM